MLFIRCARETSWNCMRTVQYPSYWTLPRHWIHDPDGNEGAICEACASPNELVNASKEQS